VVVSSLVLSGWSSGVLAKVALFGQGGHGRNNAARQFLVAAAPGAVRVNAEGKGRVHGVLCGVTGCRHQGEGEQSGARGRNIIDDYDDDTFLPVNWQQLQQQPTNALQQP